MPTSSKSPHQIGYSIKDSARRLGVGLSTMRKILASGRLPFSRISSRRILVEEAELEKFVRKSRARR